MKKLIFIVGTESGAGKGGISTAIHMFEKCFKVIEYEYISISSHVTGEGKSKIFHRLLTTLLYLFTYRFMHPFKKMCIYAHVGPKGSLLRKLIIICVGRSLGYEIVTHYHSPEFQNYLEKKNLFYYLLKSVFSLSHQNLVLTPWWHQLFEEAGLHGARIIPNAIASRELINKSYAPDSERVIFCMGRLVQEKNFQVVVESLMGLPAHYKLQIAGDGDYKNNLIELCKELQVSSRVKFLGWLDEEEKYTYLNSATVFALPSKYDSFGMVFIESLVCGLPVVTGPNPAVVSALEGLEGVYVATSFNARDVSKSILSACEADTSILELSSAVVNKYGIDVVAFALEDIFND